MKKLLVMAVLAFITCLLAVDINNIAIDGGTYTVQAGDTLRVYVNALEITEDMRVIAFQFDSYYDSTLIKYVTHKPGDLFENAMLMANGDEPGLIKVACSHWLPQKGSGTLVELVFIAQQPGETRLQFDKFKMNSTIMSQVYDAQIKIIGKKIKEDKK
jgi:hypothetical protein